MLYQLNAYPLMGSLDVLWQLHRHEGARVSYDRLGSDLLHFPGAVELGPANVTAVLGEWLLGLAPKIERRPF